MDYVETQEIAVEELTGNRSNYLLLDVREAEELEIAAIAGATHIPMGEIPTRLGELPPERPIAVLCHHGARSARVVDYLRSNGLNAFNVAGGIDAWSQRVDLSVRRY